MAEIEKLGDFPTDPKLLLQMILSNLPEIDSVVVSVCHGEYQNTYWSSPIKSSELAWHLACIQKDLLEGI